ncbi:MAG: hypothetical protein M3Q69_06245 [Acidobacteriota bacterium]|nr:hypothetical protein [Acidobacteriota bacterium]
MRSREWERRVIGVVLIAVAMYLVVSRLNTAPALLLLAVTARLLGRVVAYYFPVREGRKRGSA